MGCMKSDVSRRAEVLATAHPFGEVAENAFLGCFSLLGRVTGYFALAISWLAFHAWTLVFVIWLAFTDGFRKAAGTKAQQPAAPPGTASQLLADPRYADQNTPFGVPFGPNVHASHD